MQRMTGDATDILASALDIYVLILDKIFLSGLPHMVFGWDCLNSETGG